MAIKKRLKYLMAKHCVVLSLRLLSRQSNFLSLTFWCFCIYFGKVIQPTYNCTAAVADDDVNNESYMEIIQITYEHFHQMLLAPPKRMKSHSRLVFGQLRYFVVIMRAKMVQHYFFCFFDTASSHHSVTLWSCKWTNDKKQQH